MELPRNTLFRRFKDIRPCGEQDFADTAGSHRRRKEGLAWSGDRLSNRRHSVLTKGGKSGIRKVPGDVH